MSSNERKFTALDAINGYDKYEDSTEGLIDKKFSKKIGIFGSPNSFSPQYIVRSGTMRDKNMRMISQR